MSHNTWLAQTATNEPKVDVSISPEVLKTLAQADLGRLGATDGKKDSKDNKTAEKKLSDQMVSLGELASRPQFALHAIPIGVLSSSYICKA